MIQNLKERVAEQAADTKEQADKTTILEKDMALQKVCIDQIQRELTVVNTKIDRLDQKVDTLVRRPGDQSLAAWKLILAIATTSFINLMINLAVVGLRGG